MERKRAIRNERKRAIRMERKRAIRATKGVTLVGAERMND